jgi:uncharacterized protein
MFHHDESFRERRSFSDSPSSPRKSVPEKKNHSDWMSCPICELQFDRNGSNHLPFCSPRCRQIDLGRWLNESYGLPYEGDDRPAADDVDTPEDE